MANSVRIGVEALLAATRWLLLPFYLAIALALIVMLVKVGMRIWDFALNILTLDADQTILAALAIGDLALTASLLVIISLAGYVNFISPIDVKAHPHWPNWISEVDFAELKRKLLGSVLTISAIKLLEIFMNIGHNTDRDVAWMIGIHVVFAISAVLLALSDRLGGNVGSAHGSAAS